MGSTQSRSKGPVNGKQYKTGGSGSGEGNSSAASPAYFIMALKGEKIKLVNVDSQALRLLSQLIKKHFHISKEGWDRQMTYSFKLGNPNRMTTIQFVSDLLLSLYDEGWEPMTPIDMAAKMRDEKINSTQTAVCFRRKVENKKEFGSSTSLSAISMGSKRFVGTSSLCIEIYMDNFLGFHNVPNTLLYEIVTTLQTEWTPGIQGISMAIASVIGDYAPSLPPILVTQGQAHSNKYLQLVGCPWRGETEGAERLQVAIIAVLANSSYKLSMSIDMDTNSRVYFFILDPDCKGDSVRIPLSYSGLGQKDPLGVYQPMVIRSKASVYMPGGKRPSFKKLKASLRRKTLQRQERQNTVMTYKPEGETLAWWQQRSMDMSDNQ